MTSRTPHRRGAALVAAGALLLAACGSQPDIDREVKTEHAEPTIVDTSDMNVPIALDGLEVLDPGWDLPPQFADGIYISASLDDVLTFEAMTIFGEVLWSTQRPSSFTDFAVTSTSDGMPVAVLLDDGESTSLSAQAYDLRTGESLWGPVDVPGSFEGPGLIFSDEGERFTLNPDDGTMITGPYLAEHSGTLLAAEEEGLSAVDPSGTTLWSVDAGEPTSTEWVGMDGEYALLREGDRGRIIDVATGQTVAESAQSAGVDPATGTLVVRDASALHAYGEGEALWSITVGPETELVSVGGIFAYLREGDAIRVHNVLTGAIAQAYYADGEGTVLVPAHVTPQGAALLFGPDGGYLLAAVPEQPSEAPAP